MGERLSADAGRAEGEEGLAQVGAPLGADEQAAAPTNVADSPHAPVSA